MRKLIFLFSSFLVFSCGNSETVTVSREEYNKLKNIPPPREVIINEEYYEIKVASDGHEYYSQIVDKGGYVVGYIWLHYIDCKFCAKNKNSNNR